MQRIIGGRLAVTIAITIEAKLLRVIVLLIVLHSIEVMLLLQRGVLQIVILMR